MQKNEQYQIENALKQGKVYTRKYQHSERSQLHVLGHICKVNDKYLATKKNFEMVLDFRSLCHNKELPKEILPFNSLREAHRHLSP